MEDSPDVINQVPAGGGVNEPASGTYGEKAELDRLRQQLPSSDPVQPTAPPTGGAAPAGRAPTGPSPAGPGLPAGITAPTTRPDVPAMPTGQPPTVDPFAGAVDAAQRRLRLLDMIETSQEASPELREWAAILKSKLIANASG